MKGPWTVAPGTIMCPQLLGGPIERMAAEDAIWETAAWPIMAGLSAITVMLSRFSWLQISTITPISVLMQSATEMTPGHQIQLGPPHHILDTKMGLELGLDAREPASFLGCIPYLAYWDRFVKGYDAKETHKLALVRAQSHAGLLAQGVNLIHLEVADAPRLIIDVI